MRMRTTDSPHTTCVARAENFGRLLAQALGQIVGAESSHEYSRYLLHSAYKHRRRGTGRDSILYKERTLNVVVLFNAHQPSARNSRTT